jgi:excisionase family DNA binding protein
MDVTDHWVYKAYDQDGRLLYVGVTGVGPRRLAEHSRGSAWAPLVDRFAIEHVADRSTALARERHLIAEREPPFNSQSNPAAFDPGPGNLSVNEAAVYSRASVRTLNREIREGRLVARRRGRRYAIALTDLVAWIEAVPAGPAR